MTREPVTVGRLTTEQQRDLFGLAKGLLPFTTDLLARQLVDDLKGFDFELIKQAIQEQARSEDNARANVNRITERVKALAAAPGSTVEAKVRWLSTPAPGATERQRREVEAADRRRDQAARDKRLADASHQAALAFCAAAPANQLEEWRRAVVQDCGPLLARAVRDKPTLSCTTLVAAIHQRFRAAGTRPGAGAIAAMAGAVNSQAEPREYH